MSKIVSFGDNSLTLLKKMVLKEDKSLAELDEYEIGSEGSANDYFHVVDNGNIEENLELEVEPNEVNLSSFRKRETLAPKIWNGEHLNSRARLKLLDIADDFWETVGTDWVKRKGIVLTGSICNYNWSKFSDIDLHIIVDFSDVDERTDFVQEYYDSKKNEWNNEHDNLRIYGFNVEVYIEDVNANTESGGIYDLEKNSWIKKPNIDDIHSISLNKYDIKNISAKLMTKIDDYNDKLNNTDDNYELSMLGKKAHYLLNKIKAMRKYGLKRDGEMDSYNIVYKVLKRSGYLDKLWDISSNLYDKINSIGIEESKNMSQYIYSLINEEVVADGNADHNVYAKRWKHEREVLKNYIVRFGTLMTSMENGKTYKVVVLNDLYNILGNRYCLCLEYNQGTMKEGRTVYVRAYDKFTLRMFKPEFDTRGKDNDSTTAY